VFPAEAQIAKRVRIRVNSASQLRQTESSKPTQAGERRRNKIRMLSTSSI